MIEGVINELSMRQAYSFMEVVAQNEVRARNLMSDFVICISEGMRQHWIKAIRTNYDFQFTELAPNYSLTQWRNDRLVNRDERALFRRFITASPYLEAIEQEVRVGEALARGLSSCVINNSISLSWNSDTIWDSSEIDAEILKLDDQGEVSTSAIQIKNVARRNHWTSHAAWIRDEQISKIKSGLDLLNYSAEIYPRLSFGKLATKQVSSLSGNESYFKWIVDSLRRADIEVAGWTGGPFVHANLPGPASGESSTVNESPRLRSQRMFETFDERREYCEFHMKHRGENQRIHYRLDPVERRMVICYVGEHLETANY